MSKVRPYMDWSETSEFNKTPRTRKYDWPNLLDGRIHELFPGVDFDGNAQSLTSVIRTTANRKKVRVRVRVIPNESNVGFIEDLRVRLGKAKGQSLTLGKEVVERLLDLADGLDGSTVVLQQHDDDYAERGVTRSPSRASLAAAAEPSTNGDTAAPPAKKATSRRPTAAKKAAAAAPTPVKAAATKKVGKAASTAKKVARKKVSAPA